MPMLMRPRIHHVGLTVTDLDRSIAWYERVFALTLQMEIPHHGGTGKVLVNDD